jgi:hypothetical protein
MRLPLSLIAAALLCAVSAPASSSGDDGAYVNPFASQFQPSRLPNYAGGNLGVVQGSYWRLYQYLAYKAAQGKPLTPQQVAALEPSQWRVGPGAVTDYAENPERNGTGDWNAKRDKYAALFKLPAQESVGFMSEGMSFESYVNCHADAFRQAAATLEARAKLGADAWTRQWLLGQNAVFSNCEEPQHAFDKPVPPREALLPPPLPKGAPDWLKFDHAYQSAAANFYARKLDTARAQFQAIALQAKSPWQPLGNYLAARSLIRKAALEYPLKGEAPAPQRATLLAQAKQELEAMSASYAPAKRMLALVDARIDPDQRIAALARILDKEPFSADTPALLSDYLVLLDSQEQSKTMQAKEPLTAWIGAMQAPAERRALALETLRKSWLKQADPLWLAPLLNLAQGGELSASERKAAAALPAAHPLYVMLQYHLARLAIAENEHARADKNIDRLFASHGKTMSVATTNRLLALKMATATTLDGFMTAAMRRPEEIGMPDATTREPVQAAQTDSDFDRVALRMLPMPELKALIKHPALPAAWKPKLQETLFTRALIFGDEASALDLLDTMAKGRKTTAHLYARYRAAATGAERKLAGNIILVNTPELEPAVLGNGAGSVRYWGCGTPSYKFPLPESDTPVAAAPPRFLNQETLAKADQEHKLMLALPLRSEYLAPSLLEWAATKPADDEAPKALHLLVAATRMECTSGTEKPEKEQMRARYSRAAFEMLKKDYRDTKWAKATKYFY